MAGWRDIDRTYKCLSEWRSFLVKSCICSFILSCFWQPYECVTGVSNMIKGILGSCESLCLLFIVLFNFFLVSFVVGSLWVVLRSSSVIWRSLWVVPEFSDYHKHIPPNRVHIIQIPSAAPSFMGIWAIRNPLKIHCYTCRSSVTCWSQLIYTKLSLHRSFVINMYVITMAWRRISPKKTRNGYF